MSEELTIEGYCLKCKEKRPMSDARAEWAANGSPATRGTCPVCGANMYKRGHTAAHDALPKPEPAPRPKKRAGRKKGKSGASATASKKKGGKNGGRKGGKRAGAKEPAVTNGSGGKKARTRRRSGRLVIVESPAKAKTIGRYLGPGYKVLSSVGHVRDLLKSRLSVDIDNDFEPEYRVPNDKRGLVKELKEAAERATEVFLATDRDREGEAIAWHVMESAEMDPERTRRVVFQEITRAAIQDAFARPQAIDMDQVNAQQARRVLDRLVGYKLSPLLWRKVRGRLSAGRVQSVAVRLVVEREREIDSFVPVEYWTVDAELAQQATRRAAPRPFFKARLHKINDEDPQFDSEETVRPHVTALENAAWEVSAVRLGKRTRKPAAPFTTSTLQQEASRKLNFGTSKTMRVAQQLYEGIEIGGEDGSTGLITYMRTDSVAVARQAQEETRAFVVEKFGDEYVPEEPRQYRSRARGAQEAHEAIRPTSTARTPKRLKAHLTKDQYRLYRLVWERFVASQMANAEYDTVSVDIMAGPAEIVAARRPYLFRASGSTLRFPGFLALYEETEPEDRPEEGDDQVPTDLQPEEQLDLLALHPEQHFTQPPPRYSEATLVRAMEEHGIGRPSTYASIISTIQKRGYVELDSRRLVPTPIGEHVNDLLVDHFPNVLSVDFTARLEDELDEIAEGQAWVPVIRDFYERFSENLARADKAIKKVQIQSEPEYVGRDCPLCGNALVYREGRYGRFIGCSNFPTCRHTEQILVKVGVTCPQCNQGDVVERRTRKGRVFYGCTRYPDCDWTSWTRPEGARRPGVAQEA